VEPDIRQFGSFERSLERAEEVARLFRRWMRRWARNLASASLRKAFFDLANTLRTEHGHQGCGQRDCASRAIGLGLYKNQPAALLTLKRLRHGNAALLKVNVLSAQAQNLAHSQSTCQCHSAMLRVCRPWRLRAALAPVQVKEALCGS
jgi:hypothetical protein